MQKYIEEQEFNLPGKHLKVTNVKLIDRTDENDFLVKEYTQPVYRGRYTASGNIFIIDAYVDNKALVIVSDAPMYANAKIKIGGGKLTFDSDGYEAVYSYCESDKANDTIRNYYRECYKGDIHKHGFTMSNTWGDRAMGNKLCHDFIKAEIDMAYKLGVDIVQIDDGWQIGNTKESLIVDENGGLTSFRKLDEEFWTLNNDKFPHGLKSLADYASDKGVILGLWFIPDSYNDFENRDRDIKLLEYWYKEWNIRYFKLDGVVISSRESEKNFIEFLDKLSKIGNDDISFNLDLTAGDRLGYLYGKEYGTIFVENRYTDWGNYYPHNTLKNLWMLSKYIPADKFQFEVLNCKRNADKYPNDPLAPFEYDIDYTFAAVMFSNPLIWMEMQNLADEEALRLQSIIKIFKEHRDNIFGSDIYQLGEMPDGTTFTGFYTKDYILVFREYNGNESDTYDFNLKVNDVELICSNTDIEYTLGDKFTVKFGKKRSYAFFKIK